MPAIAAIIVTILSGGLVLVARKLPIIPAPSLMGMTAIAYRASILRSSSRAKRSAFSISVRFDGTILETETTLAEVLAERESDLYLK